jgi:hypothetical protein
MNHDNAYQLNTLLELAERGAVRDSDDVMEKLKIAYPHLPEQGLEMYLEWWIDVINQSDTLFGSLWESEEISTAWKAAMLDSYPWISEENLDTLLSWSFFWIMK